METRVARTFFAFDIDGLRSPTWWWGAIKMLSNTVPV
jgi:hypothetical protein